ncbi:DUF2158 domain-containing protein [Labrenzia sp. DG1229]|uniref:DUF2158 domain-containing protein n=1 Tax=Labrenzia sp. DG1229 TaxID=681847 RepID=UPI00048C8442|nr:DUF2158 domain-containing protein [Labrenzia sp. DG1229]
MQTIYVYGPPASGKTINRLLIAEFLNCDTIVDGCCIKIGGRKALKIGQTFPEDAGQYDRTYDIEEIRKYILNHPKFAHRWSDPAPAPITVGWDLASTAKHIADFEPRLSSAEGKTARPDPEPWRPQLGDVVHLKSCHQGMTVVSDCCCGPVDVSWFDGTTLQTETFPIECLATSERNDAIPF